MKRKVFPGLLPRTWRYIVLSEISPRKGRKRKRERERERDDGAEKEIPRDLVASILRSNSKRAAAIKVGGDGSAG